MQSFECSGGKVRQVKLVVAQRLERYGIKAKREGRYIEAAFVSDRSNWCKQVSIANGRSRWGGELRS